MAASGGHTEDVNAALKKIQQKNEQTLTEVRLTTIPADYEQKIDAALDDLLKDPDSKIIEYTATPVGSLVCGKLNAKNSYGGYTGKKGFYAYFHADGTIADIQTGLDGERFPDCARITCYYYAHEVLAKQCGY